MAPTTPSNQTDPDFAFAGSAHTAAAQAQPQPPDPLGPLAQLEGAWAGSGFNTIWRPHPQPSKPSGSFPRAEPHDEDTRLHQDQLQLFPNRGLLMPDIGMVWHHLHPADRSRPSSGAGLHIEPGIWANVPGGRRIRASRPTVVRMASIPHGTAILAQGTANGLLRGWPARDTRRTTSFPSQFGTQPPA